METLPDRPYKLAHLMKGVGKCLSFLTKTKIKHNKRGRFFRNCIFLKEDGDCFLPFVTVFMYLFFLQDVTFTIVFKFVMFSICIA